VISNSAGRGWPGADGDYALSTSVKLVYSGHDIRDRNEMLSLTDMWRATKSEPNRCPIDWIRKEGAPFIEFITHELKVTHGHFEPIQSLRGGSEPGTWAHWQIAMAYAKYLSPEFYAWYNRPRFMRTKKAPLPTAGVSLKGGSMARAIHNDAIGLSP
jgi:hypothetical protein